jgi:hypothetical protein
MSVGNSRAVYMKENRKRKRLEEDNCNNVHKRTRLNAKQQREYRATHKNLYVEYMHNYRKRKAQENKTPQAGDLSLSSVSGLIFSFFVFYVLLVSSLPEVGSGRTVWRSPTSTVEFSYSYLLLSFDWFVAV